MTEKYSDNPNRMSEHERKNEGGREFGHVHSPTQAEQASRNQGLADEPEVKKAPSMEKELKRPREGERKTA